MNVTIAAPFRPVPEMRAVPRAGARRGLLLLAVVLAISAVDQLSKAWAWRNLAFVHINSGAGLLFGDRVAPAYRDGQLGAVIDVTGVLLVGGLTRVLLWVRWPRMPFLGAALVLAGWASNLADRLGLHTVTAPGSARGVVDFLRWQGRLWNVADLAMIVGALLAVAGAIRVLRTRAPAR